MVVSAKSALARVQGKGGGCEGQQVQKVGWSRRGVEKEQHRPGWDGMLLFIISGLKVTWGGCLRPFLQQIYEEYRSYFKGATRKQMSVSNSKFELFCSLCQEILNQVPLVSFWTHTFGLWCQLHYGAKLESLKGK